MLTEKAPAYLTNVVQYNTFNYNFRHGNSNVFIPKPVTEYKRRSISYKGPILWNNLNSDQKNPNMSINQLKKPLMNLLEMHNLLSPTIILYIFIYFSIV